MTYASSLVYADVDILLCYGHTFASYLFSCVKHHPSDIIAFRALPGYPRSKGRLNRYSPSLYFSYLRFQLLP